MKAGKAATCSNARRAISTSQDRKSTRLNSSHSQISYAVLCLKKKGVPILGTSPDAIDRAEDRQRFSELITELGLRQAAGATARSLEEAQAIASSIGYPALVRPSYGLAGRAMRFVPDAEGRREYVREAVQVSRAHPVLIGTFLEDAI